MTKKILVVTSIAVCFLGFKYNDNLHALGLKFVAPTIYGKANVYQPEPGEIIYDSSASKFFGHDHNSNWVELSSGGSIFPPGIILPYGGSNPPNGFLVADGSAVSRTTYSDLFAAIGTAFGAGDGVTTFNLPDLRGRFLRGVDGTAGNDPDKNTRSAMQSGGNTGNNIGSVQDDLLKSHSHYLQYVPDTSAGGSFGQYMRNVGTTGTATTTATGGNETRPKNANVNFIIKY